MKSLKKCISVLLAFLISITSVISCITPVYGQDTAYSNEKKAEALYKLGLFKGTSETKYEPDLGASLTREQGFVMLLRLFGLEEEAKKLTAAEVDEVLKQFADSSEIAASMRNQMAYAVMKGLVKGDGTNINPQQSLSGKDYSTLLLRELGYKDSEFKYETAFDFFAQKSGISFSDAGKLNDKMLIRDDLVGIAYDSLKAKDKDGKALIEKLISAKPDIKDKAAAAGIRIDEDTDSTPGTTPGSTPSPTSGTTPSQTTSTNTSTGTSTGGTHKNHKKSTPTPTPATPTPTPTTTTTPTPATPTPTPTSTVSPTPEVEADFSPSVVGAKKIELAFNKAISAEKASISVKKDGLETVVSSTYASVDNTKIYIVTDAKLSKGDYEISVAGLGNSAITKTVSAQDEKLDNIGFTCDKAVIVPVFDEVYENRSVYVYFKLLNQYGEDITELYKSYSDDIKWSASIGQEDDSDKIEWNTLDGEVNDIYAEKGRIILTKAQDFCYGNSIQISIVYNASKPAITASTVLTVSSKAGVGQINILKLYNASGEDLTINSTYSSYYLLFDLKDQYGNTLCFDADEYLIKDNLYVYSSNSSVVTFEEIYNDYYEYYNFQNIVIDGKDYIALPFEKPNDSKSGITKIIVDSYTTGCSDEYIVRVGGDSYVASFSMQEPELAVIGEKVVIPFTAYDEKGNEITDVDFLRDNIILDVYGHDEIDFEENSSTGKAQLVFNPYIDSYLEEGDTVVLTAITGKTCEESSITLTMKAPKEPAIAGISSSYYNKIAQGAFAGLKYDSLIFEDNYGRTISSGELKCKLIDNIHLKSDGTTTYSGGKYRIAVSSNSDTVKVIGGCWDTNDTTTTTDDVYCFNYSNEKVYFYGAAEGTATITVQLQKIINEDDPFLADWRNVTDAGYSFTMTTVDRDEIKSIAVDTIPTSYDYNWYDVNNNNYGLTKKKTYYTPFSVYGVLSDGSKAWLSKEILPGDTADVVDAYTISFSTDYTSKLTTAPYSSVFGDVYKACITQRFTFINSTDTLNDAENESVNVPFSITPSSAYFKNVDSISGTFTVSSTDPIITSIALTYNYFSHLSSDGAVVEINKGDLDLLKAWAGGDLNKVILKIVSDTVTINDQYGKEHNNEYLEVNSDIYSILYTNTELEQSGDRMKVKVITNNGNKSITFTITVK